MEVKPIFIIGASYSGTSILHKMIALHPDLAWFSQYSCRGGEIPNRFRLPFYKYFNRVLRSVFAHNWEKEDGAIKVIPRPGEAHQIWRHIFPKDAELSQEEYIKRLRIFLGAECEAWHKNFILTKSIRFQYYLPILKTAFPEAKFIHIIRDGRAITLSRKYKGGQALPFEHFLKRARVWAETIEEINRQRERLGFFEFRYEDFCLDVHGYLKRILNYAGLDAAKFPFNKCPKILNPTNSKWFEMATNDEIAEIENVQKEILKQYGYIK